jgi:hypothetical protein
MDIKKLKSDIAKDFFDNTMLSEDACLKLASRALRHFLEFSIGNIGVITEEMFQQLSDNAKNIE